MGADGGVAVVFGFGRKKKVDPFEAERRAREAARFVAEVRRLNARPAWVMRTEAGAPGDPLGSGLGGVGVGLAGEAWPEDRHGPMRLLARLDLSGLEGLPGELGGVGYVVVWEPWDARETVGEADGGDAKASRLLVRAYPSRDGLVELEKPAGKKRRDFEYEPVGGAWEAIESWPESASADEFAGLVRPDGFDAEIDAWANDSDAFDAAPVNGHQVGGWPTLVQGMPWWERGAAGVGPWLDGVAAEAEPAFCLQIAEDEASGVNFGDFGVLLLARGTAAGQEGRWFYEIQYG